MGVEFGTSLSTLSLATIVLGSIDITIGSIVLKIKKSVDVR